MSIYVPLLAKSAATLICLAGDELVVGELGELGPLDAQGNEKQQADFPVTVSRLGPFKALEQLDHAALGLYDSLVSRIVDKGGMRLFDACSKAAELTSGICTAIYSQIDPHRLAESARGLEIGCEYAERILRRYRPEVFARNGRDIVHRLVHAYPSHGFVLDLEELTDLGLPVRAPDEEEAPIVDVLADALVDLEDAGELIEVVALGTDAGDGAARQDDAAVAPLSGGDTADPGTGEVASPGGQSGEGPGRQPGGGRHHAERTGRPPRQSDGVPTQGAARRGVAGTA